MRSLIVLSALVLFAAPARATVLIGADLGELSHDAVAIARGRVVAVGARWTEDRRAIETLVTLEVETYLKGGFGPTLQFLVPGGELGRYRSVLVGAPEFDVDQYVIVFLGAHGPSVPYVLGLSQGVFRIIPAPDDASRAIVMTPANFPAAAGTVMIKRGDPQRRPMALQEFEQRVRALVDGAR
jgi:hypothetical protein